MDEPLSHVVVIPNRKAAIARSKVLMADEIKRANDRGRPMGEDECRKSWPLAYVQESDE